MEDNAQEKKRAINLRLNEEEHAVLLEMAKIKGKSAPQLAKELIIEGLDLIAEGPTKD